MRDLPPELLIQIFQYLNAVDLCNAGAVCKYWSSISTSEPLWRRLCGTLEMKSDLIQNDRALGYSWKEVYMMNHGSQGTRRQWLRGCHSNFTSYQQLPKQIMCTMDVEGWGQIFEMELER
ncbi:F-box only protein 48-like [Ylistrum balloti]|uniref:F-box only protein 48-like n=1 Tax=Ylistrum balloti TaxID=509963 RepID=UPI00290590CF|nr:F-box only protein 48-like [Ylistrum balloti]